jgi:hypothetical protein
MAAAVLANDRSLRVVAHAAGAKHVVGPSLVSTRVAPAAFIACSATLRSASTIARSLSPNEKVTRATGPPLSSRSSASVTRLSGFGSTSPLAAWS